MKYSNKFKVGKITQEEKNLFSAIRDPEYTNFALLKIKFQEYETSCIVSINNDDSKNYDIQPLAILVNQEILKNFKLLCPHGDPPN